MHTPDSKTIFQSSLVLLAVSLFALKAQAQPTVVSADPRGDYFSVKVIYSTTMDATSATSTGNYSLVNSGNSAVVPISTITQSADQTTVVLHLGASLQVTTNYTLTITGVTDTGFNVISPNPTIISFFFGGPPGGISFNFDNGLVPTNTFLATTSPGLDTFNGSNPTNTFEGVTNAGGFNNSGCLILVSNIAGQTYGQWHNTNAYFLAGGQPVTNFDVKFKFWMVNLDPSFTLAADTIGNGFVFHVGPDVPQQYTGGASSWGNGLDLTFRNFANGIIPQGADIFWYPPYTENNTVGWTRNTDTPAGTIPNTAAFLTTPPFAAYSTNWVYTNAPGINAFVDTNGIGGGATSFSNYTSVDFNVNNGVANLVCSNGWAGTVVLFTNQAISGWTPIIGGSSGSGLPAGFDFTATDGAGNHQMVVLDDVDLTVNGVHIPGSGITTNQLGNVQITTQPASVTTNENVYVTFNVSTIGATPQTYQWYSNGIAIAGATSASYRTPLTLFNMNGTAYSVIVSNDFSFATSSNAILTIIQDTNGVQVLSVGSANGSVVDVLFSSFVDTATAGNPANYLVNGVAPSAAVVRTAFANFGDPVLNYPTYLKTVELTPASSVSGNFSVTVTSGVKSRTGINVVQTNVNGTVAGMTDEDLGSPGTDPFATGEAFFAGGLREIIAGGSDIMPITANPSSEHGNFAYLSRTGSFDIAADLTWETVTANGAKAGIIVRADPVDPASAALSETVFPPTPGRHTYETAIRLTEGANCTSWALTGNGNAAANWNSDGTGNTWVRIQHVGPKFNGYTSTNGVNWTLLSTATPDTNVFVPTEYVGLIACAANNGGRLTEADFQNFGGVNFTNAVLALSPNLPLSSTGFANATFTFVIGASVSGGTAQQSDIVYQWQRAESNAPTVFSDILANGNASTYTTPTLGIPTDNGAKYRCIAWVGDITAGHSVTSVVSTLTVLVDTNPPFMVAASADSTFTTITINFDGPMDTTSLSDTSRYTITPVGGGSPITVCTANPITLNGGQSYTSVQLILCSPLAEGTRYNLMLSNILDSAGNNINNTLVPNGRTRVVTGWALEHGWLTYERWTNYAAGGSLNSIDNLITNNLFPSQAAWISGIGFTPSTVDTPAITELITYSGYPNGDALYAQTVNLPDTAARISGYFLPPADTNITFYVRGDNGTVLIVSSDNTRDSGHYSADADRDAGCNTTADRSWLFSNDPNNVCDDPYIGSPNQSAKAMLASNRYYIEALEKNGAGGGWLEFSYSLGQTNGFGDTVLFDGVEDVTNAVSTGFPAGRGGAPTNSYNIRGTNIGAFINPDLSTIVTAFGPSNATVLQNNSWTFRANAAANVSPSPSTISTPVFATVPVGYQWYSNGVAISGATNSSYRVPPSGTKLSNNNDQYSVVLNAKNPAGEVMPFMTVSNLPATLTVQADTNKPLVAFTSGFGTNAVIRYNKAIDPTTSTSPGNYAISGVSVNSAVLLSDGRSVLLNLSGALPGSNFTVTINNVQDAVGNTIASGTIATGNVLANNDIGVATSASGLVVQTNATLTNITFNLSFPGSAGMGQDGSLSVQASGSNIGGQQDGMNYTYEQRSGDFDIKVKVNRIDGSDARAKAGLMMRESLIPGSRDYSIVVEPAATNAVDGNGVGYNGVEIFRRTTNNLGQLVFAANQDPPVLLWQAATNNYGVGTNMYPLWLRLRRSGNSVYAYTGADGTNWYLCGREVNTTAAGQSPWPATVYVGMAATAATNGLYTTANFSGYDNFVAPPQRQALLIDGGNNGGGKNGLVNGGSFGGVGGFGGQGISGSGVVKGVTIESDSAIDTPAGAPNAPLAWSGSGLYMYNLLTSLGYSVTVVHGSVCQTEDGRGMSLIQWSGEVNSGDLGNPNKFIGVPAALVVSKYATLEKTFWITNGNNRGNPSGQTAVQIFTTNDPITMGAYQPNQIVMVSATNQFFSYGFSNELANGGLGFTVVGGNPNNLIQTYLAYADVGTPLYPKALNNGSVSTTTSNTVTNRTAARCVSLWLGDNGGSTPWPFGDFSKTTADGQYLLLNALKWATLTETNPPTLTGPANQTVAAGNTATFSVTPAGPAGPFTYQWFSNGVSVAGANFANYTTPATTLANSGDQYQVVVGSMNGSVTSVVATLTVQAAINITAQPQNQTVNPGSTAMFCVTASGTSPAYQWFSNNVAIAGATSSCYTTPALTLANNGDAYKVVVTNLVSSQTSSNAISFVVLAGSPGFNPPFLSGGKLVLSWSNASTLLSSTNLTTPLSNWLIVTGATSPFTNTPTNGATFFDLKQ